MAHKPKPKVQEEESGEGAPLWIISFADMMSLLMAFFVMLSTFSSFGPAESAKLHKAVKAALMSDYFGGWFRSQPRGAMGPQSLAAGQLEKASEKPTLEEAHGGGLLAETEPLDFRTRKIFAVESKSIFWAAGTALSSSGHDFLDNLAAFLRSMPDRLIISEGGPPRPKAADGTREASNANPPAEDPELGLRRALVVVKYLTRKGIPQDRFSIGMEGMRPDVGQSNPGEKNDPGERILEIVLLDESAYQ